MQYKIAVVYTLKTEFPSLHLRLEMLQCPRRGTLWGTSSVFSIEQQTKSKREN